VPSVHNWPYLAQNRVAQPPSAVRKYSFSGFAISMSAINGYLTASFLPTFKLSKFSIVLSTRE
jgi:hypothetical protein